MKGRPIDQLVYETMFPKPRQQDPHNFQALLQRHLVLEVRQEVHSFYGHLDTQEAKYPGLDYTNHIHRIRLSRWQWHRRLFRAFDALRLTHAEISGLTKWEGTKWAKERFEREQGVIIRDTTADGFPEYVEPENRRRTPERQQRSGTREREEQRIEVVSGTNDENIGEESEEELESVGAALNERLRERVALRNESGDLNIPIDEEWEMWLKNAIEAGDIQITSQLVRFSQTDDPSDLLNTSIFPPRMVAAARAGRWDEIPDPLRGLVRQSLQVESTSQPQPGTTRRSVPAPNPNTRTSGRLPRPRDYPERDEERRVEPPPHVEAA
ncbi:hypothetical protein OQA88_3638 [Cercophora sp. LCS_1]